MGPSVAPYISVKYAVKYSSTLLAEATYGESSRNPLPPAALYVISPAGQKLLGGIAGSIFPTLYKAAPLNPLDFVNGYSRFC